MISADEVRHIAKLARLGLKDDSVEKFANQLSSIMAYFDKLNEVDVSHVEATSQVTGLENVMRDDVIKPIATREELLSATQLPIEREQIKVQSVITQ